MKTIKAVIEENKDFASLIRAVVNNIGKESIQDVNNHGIDGGFGGFIYNKDTHAFAMKHRKLIVKLLEQQADDLGEEVV